MFKVKILRWIEGELKAEESYWHNVHQARAFAESCKEGTRKVYNSNGEIMHAFQQQLTNNNTYA
jgi:hypothetical protein